MPPGITSTLRAFPHSTLVPAVADLCRLSPLGEQQAQELGTKLAGLLRPDVILVSPLTRAITTAQVPLLCYVAPVGGRSDGTANTQALGDTRLHLHALGLCIR